MNQLIYELNNKKYLLFEMPITSNKASMSKKEKLIKDCNGIIQGVKDIRIGGLFSQSHMILMVLIPEEFIDTFSNAE